MKASAVNVLIKEQCVNMYNPFAAPLNPSEMNDEFNTDLSAWSLFDFEDKTDAQIVSTGLEIGQQGSVSGDYVSGITRALPAGDFTVETFVTGSYIPNPDPNSYMLYGFMLMDGVTGTSPFLFYTVFENYVFHTYINAQPYVRYNFKIDANVILIESVGTNANGMFLRLRKNGTNYYGDISKDGISWKQMFATALGYTPTHIGLGVQFLLSFPRYTAKYQFFRYTDSDVGLNGHIGGQRTS